MYAKLVWLVESRVCVRYQYHSITTSRVRAQRDGDGGDGGDGVTRAVPNLWGSSFGFGFGFVPVK